MQLWDKKMGEGIKLRRKEMNIRQVDLAKRLHVNHPQYLDGRLA